MNLLQSSRPSALSLTYALPVLILASTGTTQWASPIYMTLGLSWAVGKSFLVQSYTPKLIKVVTQFSSWIIAAIAAFSGLVGLSYGAIVNKPELGLLIGLFMGIGLGATALWLLLGACALCSPTLKSNVSQLRWMGLILLQGFGLATAVILGGGVAGTLGVAIAILWGIIVTVF